MQDRRKEEWKNNKAWKEKRKNRRKDGGKERKKRENLAQEIREK